jgi:hypothetical protein
MAEQLVKKEGQGYNRVYPKTFTDAVVDRATGQSLIDILANFNCYFLSYAGDDETTRLQVPSSLRRQGLWITYIPYNGTTTVEYYSSNVLDDDSWKSSKNWMNGSNNLVGDVTISSEGHWVVNGTDTGVTAKGDSGASPLIRVENNRFQVSYNEGKSFVDLSDLPVITKFRVENNKLQISTDLGSNWQDVSDPISAKFQWVAGDFDTVGKIQVCQEKKEGKDYWEDLVSFSNTLKVQAYYKELKDAPDDAPEGYIIMVGPFYDESDSPKYELYIYLNSGWFDVGSFQSIQSGVTGEVDESSPDIGLVVPTSEAVINYIKPLKEKVETLEGQLNNLTIETPLSESAFESLEGNGELKENSLYFVFENDEEEGT